MHRRGGTIRHLLTALVLISLALPLWANPVTAGLTGTSTAHAQAVAPDTIPGVGSVTPPLEVDALNSNYTSTFTCLSTTVVNRSSGCFDVIGTVTQVLSSAGPPLDGAQCAGVDATLVAGAVVPGQVNCTSVANPIAGAAGAPTATNEATLSFQPQTPTSYTISWTGFVLEPAGGCPSGTGPVESKAIGQLGTVDVCPFKVQAEKKAAQITSITLAGAPCTGGGLLFVESFKEFFGPGCVLEATVLGTIVLKTGIDCTLEVPNGTPGPAGVGGVYNCTNGSLQLINVPVPGVNLSFSLTGPASFDVDRTLQSTPTGNHEFCAGIPGDTQETFGPTDASGTVDTSIICPTGPGQVSAQACLIGPLIDAQPMVCSNVFTFTFTATQTRVVPQVRWAGEKIVLTKCFGSGLARSAVEFSLKGNQDSLAATLIPVNIFNIRSTVTQSNTVWTTTDRNGCASVIGLADGEGVMSVDAAVFSPNECEITSASGQVTPDVTCTAGALINEHVFQVFYLKIDRVDLENVAMQTVQTSTLGLNFEASTPPPVATVTEYPGPPGSGSQAVAGVGYPVPVCLVQFLRAMVHGYFEWPGDPSGRPASIVPIQGAPSGSAGSYQLPAGRWILPEDWPVLASFAGASSGSPFDITPSSVFAWDLNSGWLWNRSERPIVCTGATTGPIDSPMTTAPPTSNFFPPISPVGPPASTGYPGTVTPGSAVDLGPCAGQDVTGQIYTTAPTPCPAGFRQIDALACTRPFTASFTSAACAALGGRPGTVNGLVVCVLPTSECEDGATVGMGPFDPTQACTNPFPLTYTPPGAAIPTQPAPNPSPFEFGLTPTGPNSTYLPNGTLSQGDAPMPPAQITFGITSGPGFLDQVNKTQFYAIPTSAAYQAAGGPIKQLNPNPFYSEAIPANPAIPPIDNNGGYQWSSWNTANECEDLIVPQCSPSNPYPFWQWLPITPRSSAAPPTVASVYSDNHGEAVVSLESGLISQVAPTNGTCPAGYTLIPEAQFPNQSLARPAFCLLNFASLPAGFTGVANLQSAGFSPTNPGCITTSSSGAAGGTFAPSPAPNQQVGLNGPVANQICFNTFGAVEFGPGAIIGSTTVQAVADYPYFREHPAVASAPLTKQWTSAFVKRIDIVSQNAAGGTCTVSSTSANGAGITKCFVNITALDICGNPLQEPVNVTALGSPGAAVLLPFGNTIGNTNGSNSATVIVDAATGMATLSLEILNSQLGTGGLTIKAEFPFERIEREVVLVPPITPPSQTTQTYLPGWNQIGGPQNSNFSSAEAGFVWDAVHQTYVNITGSMAGLSSQPVDSSGHPVTTGVCQGYWAYFASPMQITLPDVSRPGDQVTCQLSAGWNLVGNPFSSAANISAATPFVAWHWNGTSYDQVTSIPLGGSVWIFDDGTLPSVTVTAT